MARAMRSSTVQRPISKVLLEGLYDKECVLSQLRGCQHVMRRIWEELLDYWTQAIRLPVKDFVDENAENLGVPKLKLADEDRPQPFYLAPIDVDPDLGSYGFPNRRDTKEPININMMPFIAEADFDECKLPEFVRPYWSLIQVCHHHQHQHQHHHRRHHHSHHHHHHVCVTKSNPGVPSASPP